MIHLLPSRCLVYARCMSLLRYPIMFLVTGLFLIIGGNVKAQLYWRIDNLTAAVNTSNWSTTGVAPFTNAWVANSNIIFSANSNISNAATGIGNVTVTTGTTNWAGSGTYSTGGAVRTFNIATGATLNWNAQNATVVSGTGFIKTGDGTWNLGAQNGLFPGGFTLSNGTILFSGNNTAFGSNASLLAINGGTIANNSGSLRIIAKTTVNVGGNFQIGSAAGTNPITFSGGIDLGGANRTITIGSGNNYTFSGSVSNGGLTIATASTGRIILTNTANSYAGGTTINSGILQAGATNSLPTNTALSLANIATPLTQFQLSNNPTAVGSIAGGGPLGGNILLGTGALTTGNANTNTSYGGIISGTGSFTKVGTGTQTLSGANSYTGATNINAGALFVNGSLSPSSVVTVAANATIGGSGTIPAALSLPATATISPGSADAATGTLNTGALSFAANSIYKVEVSNVAGTAGGTSGWDLINSSGAINVTATPIILNLTNLAGSGFDFTGSYTWIIATGASIVGFNAGNFTINRASFTGSGVFTIEQSGNSIQLVYTPPSGNSIVLVPSQQLVAGNYCNGAINNVLSLTYQTSGLVTAPAIELSNSAGSFASGTVQLAGTISGTGTFTITGTIPAGHPVGTQYRVRIVSADAIPVISVDNDADISITNAVAPSVSIAITTGANPSCAGSSLTFTATPTNGGGTPGYQWKNNGINISGAISATYTTTSLVSGDIISCELNSSLACITAAAVQSNSINMLVNPLPANPANPTAAGANPACNSNSLNSMVPDAGTNFYWQGTVANGQSTVNPTSSAYAVNATGTYYVTSQSADGCWSAGSGSIALTVNPAASISADPANQSISEGTNASFTVTATNATAYQWQVDQGSGFADVVNGGVYAGATLATLSVTAVPAGYNGYLYRCVVKSGVCADISSAPATLAVNPVAWEDFEPGTKGGYTNDNVTCKAGSWAFNNALLGTDASDYKIGGKAARIQSAGLIAMNFDLGSLGVVRLSHRMYAGDANSTWQLQASIDGGTSWTAFTSPVFTSTSSVQTTNILVNIVGTVRFRIVNLEGSGNRRINIDDIYITAYTGCATPTSQSSFVNVTAITTTSLTINFAAGTGGTGRIVVMKQGSAIGGFPTATVNYVANNNFVAAAATIAANEKVVYNGAGTSVNVTNLTPNTTYYFEIFEFATGYCYLVTASGNTGSATTLCNTPVTGASGVNTTLITANTATINFTAGSGTNRLVVVNASAGVGGTPVNGTAYTANASYSAAPAFTPGTGKIVYNGTGTSVALTNLANNTVYHIAVFEFNSATNCYVNTAATAFFATNSSLSDIVSANGEAACISSVVNGAIASVANGTQVWQFTVRDGGGAVDADALPTIINSIVLTQGSGNTVTNWTNIQAAALFDGATLISNGVITATNISFSGAPLLTVADNSTKTLSVRITLQASLTNPATIDGRQVRFSITPANINLAASGTSGKNASALVATSNAAQNPVCVVATKLVFTTQPTQTGQDLAMTPTVVVTAYDANNNVDLSFTQSVSITSTAGAGLVGTPLSVTAIAGVATFTGIKHAATGTGFVMTATSTGVSNAVSTPYNIVQVTVFSPGDFAIIGVNNQNSNDVDEITFVVFRSVVTGTSFYMTDNGYERVNAGQWGTSEGIVRFTYTGTAQIDSGTILVVQGNDNSFTILKCGLNDNANWSIDAHELTTGNFNLNSDDQVWFMQGGAWSSATGSLTGHDAVYSGGGKVLYGWTGINWKSNIGTVPTTWTTRGSRIYPQMKCFSTNLNLGTDVGRYKYNGPTTAATRLGWITRINDISNWASYANNTDYNAAATPNYVGGGICKFDISTGTPVDGKWTGTSNTDWFDCNNWDTRTVPDATISVLIDNSAANPCVVDNTINAANAIQYGNAANCFNLTVTGVGNGSLSTGSATDTINVNGNFVLNAGSQLNMTNGGLFNLQSGSWWRNASATFTSGTGTVSYNSPTTQTIVGENYYHLTSTSTGDRVMDNLATVGIAGAFTKGTNAYTFAGNTVNYNGAASQNITPITASLAPGSTYNNLTLSNGSSQKTLIGSTDIEGDLTLNNSIVLRLGANYLNLKSTATRTARVAPVSPTASIDYSMGAGRFVVERYFPGRRKWRMITAPVTVDAAKSVYHSWQAGGASPVGNGTYVTGPSPSAANGLDMSPQNNFSLRVFNSVTRAFDGVADTKTKLISGTAGVAGTPDNTGFYMFVRGDRTAANANAFNPSGVILETTLRDTGRIQMQSYTFPGNPVVGEYVMVGNPYASPVDFAQLSRTGIANKFYAWDPGVNGTHGVGSYVLVDVALGTVVTVPTAGGSGVTQTQIIQSKQAVLVETSGASPSITFNEAAKSSANNLNLFRPSPQAVPSIALNLHATGADNEAVLADGVLMQLRNDFSDGLDHLDSKKLNNVNETFGIMHNGINYMLERRKPVVAGDTIFFDFKKTKQLAYRFNFIIKNMQAAGLTAYLCDTYLQKSSPVNMNGDTWIEFDVNSEAASAVSNRFYLVFKKAFKFKHIAAATVNNDVEVHWAMENETTDISYEVERSIDGHLFEKVGTIGITSIESKGFNFVDAALPAGNYFYRVKAISNSNGIYAYSDAAAVKVLKDKSGMYVYPNPVTNNVIGIKMPLSAQTGQYQVRLLSSRGEAVFSTSLQYNSGSNTINIHCPPHIAAGNYKLEIAAPDKKKTVLNVLIVQ